jgi:hypothetical protein
MDEEKTMPEEILPDDPSVRTMLRWIATTYHMQQTSLARMFERSERTIRSWMKDGRISHENLMKVRASFYHLHNAKDPHTQERKCLQCGHWRPAAQYRGHAAICDQCRSSRRKPGSKAVALTVSRKNLD